jgi:hypothetical protein
LAFASGAILPDPHTAHAEIEVRSTATSNRFPDGVSFTIFMASNANITNVRLKYRVLPDGPISFARPQCTSGNVVNCTAVVGDTQQSYLVPGAEIVHSWEIEDAAGQKLESEQATVTYRDSRFQWESITDGKVTVYYYFGDDAGNQSVLRTTRETLDRIAALEGTTVDFPVKVWVYQTARDLREAAGGTPAAGGHTLGQVSVSDTAIVSRDTDFLNVVRHEVAHLVTRRASRSAEPVAGNYTRYEIPSWVNEGISTYTQTRLLPGEEQVFANAVRANRVLPITSLSAALRGTDFALAYAQSGSIISYVVNTYGPEKFAQFIAGLRTDNVDGALQKAFGVNQLQLENAWRQSLNLPPVAAAAGGQSQEPDAVPTIRPFGAPGGGSSSSSTPAAGESEGSASAESDGANGGGSSGVVIAAAAAVVVAVIGAGGFLLLKRRRTQTPV